MAKDGEILPQCPYAPNCRCHAAPVMRPPKSFAADPRVAAEFRTATEKHVVDPAAYDTWFARATDPERRAAVGTRRYQAMEKRLGDGARPDWQDFLAPDGRLLTVQEIKTEQPQQRSDRKASVNDMLRQREALYRQVHKTGFVDRLAAEIPASGSQPQPSSTPPRPKPISSPSPPPRTPEQLREDRIQRVEGEIVNRSIEYGVILDAQGTEVFRKRGGRTSVKFYPPELQRMRDCTLVHNHPVTRSQSGAVCRNIPLSGADARLMIRNRLHEIRAVTDDYRFVMRLREDLPLAERLRIADAIKQAWEDEVEARNTAASLDLMARVRRRELTPRAAEQLYYEQQATTQHEAWVRLAGIHPIEYIREARHG